jgi:molybdenum cofactor cytidylyltransferase
MTTGGYGALVLAAGKGTRAGAAKLRLTIGGETFLHRSVRILRTAGVDDIVCVVSQEEAAWAVGEISHAEILVNLSAAGDMLSSVRLGIEALCSCRGVLVLPVDHPCVAERTLTRLLEAGRQDEESVVKPVQGDQTGHPILLPRAMFRAVLASEEGDTLRGIIAASQLNVTYVPVDDPGVLRNINTRDDLSSLSSMEY